MEKYIIAPPAGSQTNALGAEDRPWEEVHANRYPGINEYLAEATGYGIVSGCEPSINGLTVTVSAGAIHTADGRRIEAPEQSITLDAADATKPRTDVVYLDKYGKIVKLTGELGTPAVAGSNTYTISTNFAAGDTVTFGGVVFTCTTSTQDATNFVLGTDTAISATNLATALNANSGINNIYTASTSGSVVTITEKSAGGGNTPGAMTVTGTGVITAGTATDSKGIQTITPSVSDGGICIGTILAYGNSAVLSDIRMMAMRYQNAGIANVKDFGAVGDGVADDTLAIQRALKQGGNIFFPQGQYRVTDTLNVYSYSDINLGNSTIQAETKGKDVFYISRAIDRAKGIIIRNGSIQGMYRNAVHLVGEDNFTISPENYAAWIILDGINAGGGVNADAFLKMDTAVKRVHINNCGTYTNNGIISNGKSVEIFINSCMIYTISGQTIKITSDLGSRFYAEGWTITNSEIDSQGYAGDDAISISDIFSFCLDCCYIGCSLFIKPPTTTTHTKDIIISNNVISGNLFIGDNILHKAKIYNTNISNNIFDGAYITVYASAFVCISDCCINNANYEVGILVLGNNTNIYIYNIQLSSSHKIGVYIKNKNNNVVLDNISCDGTGKAIYIDDNSTNYVLGYKGYSIENSALGSYNAGDELCSVDVTLKKGQRGYIEGTINVTEPTSNTILNIITGTGISIPNGKSWSARFIYTDNDKTIRFAIPYLCTSNYSGTIQLKHYQGAVLKVSDHSWFGITRE